MHDFIWGGASLYAIRIMKELQANCAVSLWVTGAVDQSLIASIPVTIKLYYSDPPVRYCVAYCAPIRENYELVLGVSIFPNQKACLAYSLLKAPIKYAFLVDEALINYKSFSPSTQVGIDIAVSVSQEIVSVSRDLFERVINICDFLKNFKPVILPPLIDANFEICYRRWQVDNNRYVNNSRRLTLLTVARLTPGKNLLRCIRIHALLRDAGLDFDWQIVGEGPQRQELEEEIQKNGLQESCHLLGLRHDIPELMLRADLFVLLSKSEGCPTVILESIAMSCPVVTTAVNGVDLYVHDQQNGLIINEDEEYQLRAIEGLIKNPSRIAEFRRFLINGPRLSSLNNVKDFMSGINTALAKLNSQCPLVSILIPTFNQSIYLEDAVRSALMQDYQNLEVWVLDDASTDSTPEMMSKWSHDQRLNYVRHSNNLGRVKNYRHGLYECAQGEWVAVLDGDDYYTDPHFISEAISLIQELGKKEVVFLQAGHTSIFEDGSQASAETLPLIDHDYLSLSGVEYLKFVFKTGFFTHLGIVFNRARAIAVNAYSMDISSSDMDTFLRLAVDGEVLILRKSVGCWRKHNDNASNRVPIMKLAPNIQIFRAAATLSIRRKLSKIQDFEPELTYYEAHVLAYLYLRALTNSDPGHSLVSLLKIIFLVNPRILARPKIIRLLLKSIFFFITRKIYVP